MTANCSAPIAFARRATSWALRSRTPPSMRHMIQHQNQYETTTVRRSSCWALSSMPTTINGPVDNGTIISHQRLINKHLLVNVAHTAVISMGQQRTMVMITQTKSSDKDEIENIATTQSTDNSNNSIEDATNTEGGLSITASCAARIRQLASTRLNPDLVYLRLYVDAGGCSGFQYKFLLLSEDNANGNDGDDDEEEEEDGTIDPEEDIIFIKDGMRVVIDQTSLDLLQGSTIDYVQEMIRSSFAVVGNPQSESACGCGSSFAVKNFEANPAFD